jgi:hypothetical protein
MFQGLDSVQVKHIINEKIKSNPDIFYYIEDDYIKELVDLIADGVGEAIEKNNKALIKDLKREFESYFR